MAISFRTTIRLFIAPLLLLCALIYGGLAQSAHAQSDIGYLDYQFPSGVGSNKEVTAEKPESKLWWNDGYWWASMWSNSGNAYHIFRLNMSIQEWEDMGVELDDRKASKADVLWDENSQKLYVVSHIWSQTGSAAAAGERGELFRYSYSGGAYTLDSGFPVEVNGAKTEALVVAKDSVGTLWVAYVQSSKLMVNRTLGGDDKNWDTPIQLPVGSAANVSSDDMAAIVAYAGRIGIMWSNQSGGAKMYFATHADGDGNSSADWQVVGAYTVSGDDHISLRSLQNDAAGNLFAVVKTSFSTSSNPPKPYAVVLACTAGNCSSANNWSAHTAYMTDEGSPTRSMLLIDTSNRELYVFTRVRYNSSDHAGIYYKKSSIDNINFPSGLGEPFIRLADATNINDPTSTKQSVSNTTDLVVLASDSSSRRYMHNCIKLSSGGACTAPNLPSVHFSSSSYGVSESSASTTLEVRLSRAHTAPVTVYYATSNGSAEMNSDYVAVNGELTFDPGQTSRTFSVSIQDDLLDESDETVLLALTNPTGALLDSPSAATLTIEDNDPAPVVQLDAVSYQVAEDAGAIPVHVALSQPSSKSVSVQYATSNGSASAGSEYASASGTLTFAPGTTAMNVSVNIADDLLDEEDKTFTITLSDPGSATIGANGAATVTIVDNDDAPNVQLSSANITVDEGVGTVTLTALLSAPSERTVEVGYATVDGTGRVDSDYGGAGAALIFTPGQVEQAIYLTIVDDLLDEVAETFSLKLGAAQNGTLGAVDSTLLTIEDNDAPPTLHFENATYATREDAGLLAIRVTLSEASGQIVTADLTASGTANEGSDFVLESGSVTFAPGEIAQQINVTLLNDQVHESNETVQLALSNPQQAKLDAAATSIVTIVDDDPPPKLALQSADVSVAEEGGAVVLTVTLSAQSAVTVTADYTLNSGTALPNSDYVGSSGQIHFAPGQTSQRLLIDIVDDAVFEPNELFTVTLGNVKNGSLGAPSLTTLTIVDNDEQVLVHFNAAHLQVGEADGQAHIHVVLSRSAPLPITVEYLVAGGTAGAGSDYTLSNGSLTFAPGETQKSLLVELQNDEDDEAAETILLSLVNPQNGVLGAPGDLTVTIMDDDSPPLVQFVTADYQVEEGATEAPIQVVLSRAVDTVVSVGYAATSGSAIAGQDFISATGVLTFAPGEVSKPFTVTVVDDTLDEPAEDLALSLLQPEGALLGAVSSATLTIADDDAPPVVQFSSLRFDVPQNRKSFSFAVTLSSASSMTVTVEYRSSSLQASGSQAPIIGGTLLFAPGETSKLITLSLQELEDELSRGLSVELVSSTNATLGSQSSTLLHFVSDPPPIYLPLITK